MKSSPQMCCLRMLSPLLRVLSQGNYIYGDQFGTVFVASVYESGTSTVRNGGQVRVPIKVGTEDVPEDMVFSWAVDRSNELYRLSSSGIYRVTNASVCKLSC